jgi:hypothetical protein
LKPGREVEVGVEAVVMAAVATAAAEVTPVPEALMAELRALTPRLPR